MHLLDIFPLVPGFSVERTAVRAELNNCVTIRDLLNFLCVLAWSGFVDRVF